MEKRVVVTMIAMMVFYFGFNYIYPILYPPPPIIESPKIIPSENLNTILDPPAVSTLNFPEAESVLSQPDETVAETSRDITVVTPKYTAVFTELGGRLKSFTLKNYKTFKIDPNEPDREQELTPNSGANPEFPLSLWVSVREGERSELSSLHFTADKEGLNLGASQKGSISFSAKAGSLGISRTFTFSADGYYIEQKVRLSNLSQGVYKGSIGTNLYAGVFSAQSSRYAAVAGWLNNGLFSESADGSAKKLGKYTTFYSADWLGYMDQYFLTAFILPPGGQGTNSLQDPSKLSLTTMVRDKGLVQITQFWPLNLGPSLEADYKFDFYYGPKDSQDLTSVGRNIEKSVDLGWFTVLAKPLTFLLKMFYGLAGNYGLAIIIVTILIKIALWPLTAKSYKSMKEMQKLQPRILKLREKFKDDRENLNKEMIQLYKTYKVSPVGGCLPMILQIPFFIAFYRVLDYSLELRGAPFFLWINDLSAPDRLFHFSFSLPLLDPPTGIPVLTLLMGVSMLWQQKMAPTMGDPTQAKIMMLMPIFFIFILLNMPSGLVLYWLVNNILSIFQQKLINRPTDPGKTVQSVAK